MTRLDWLSDEIQRNERRLRSIAMSEADHKLLCDLLTELHAERWQLILRKQNSTSRKLGAAA